MRASLTSPLKSYLSKILGLFKICLNASRRWPCSSTSSHPTDSYKSSTFRRSLVAMLRMMLCAFLDLLYFSSSCSMSCGDTRRFDRSMYPLSLSTLSTNATSWRPTLMSFLTERMRRRDSSESRIIPSVSSYSSSDTYTPITSMRFTSTTTVSSTSGYLLRYMRHRRLGSCPSGTNGILRPGVMVRPAITSASAPFFPSEDMPVERGT
mmetsp:Transcript_12923/g.31713  ORF Transcript_12923/g.31713 Transcript_12923/m.31713 type:complete len:208 (+) Transcript_12923:520-1143(+)